MPRITLTPFEERLTPYVRVLAYLLLPMLIAAHFWIGGVVVDAKIEGETYLLLLRDDPTGWLEVNVLTYWAHHLVKYLLLVIVVSAFCWFFWKRLIASDRAEPERPVK